MSSAVKDTSLGRSLDDREISEYANCLSSIGCFLEATHMLKDLEPTIWTLQARAFALICQWDYQGAKELLVHIRKALEVPSYTQLVNKVNYIACLISEDEWELACQEISEVESISQQELSPRLRLNLEELRLQALLGMENYDKAFTLIHDLKSTHLQGNEKLFFSKWSAVLNFYTSKSINSDELFKVRNFAVNLGKWEVVRDIDFQIARRTGNPIFISRLYFATPYKSYRQKIERHLPSGFKIPASFDYLFLPDDLKVQSDGERSQSPTYTIDIQKGIVAGSRLRLGMAQHRLLCILVGDLYRAHSTGSIFQMLFPGENFNYVVSPNRVHQAIKVLRQKLDSYNMTIIENGGAYRLGTRQIAKFVIPKNFEFENRVETTLYLVQETLPETFTTKDVTQKLNCSIKTAQRLINQGIEAGKCIKVSQGNKTSFRWVS
jgi:hypothetical protein